MINVLTNLKWPAILGALLILPLMILEWVNRRAFNEGFPLGLFGILWLLPVVFMMILLPIMRNVRVGNSIMANPLTLLLKIILLILIAWLWITTILDQMPCFVGIPNCD